MDLDCPHFILCSGCTRAIKLEQPSAYEDARVFFLDRGVFNLRLHTGPIWGWRCRAKLATRGSFLEPLVGLFEKGTHQVVDIPLCRVHHPAINAAASALRAWITERKISLYDEKSCAGLLRYVQLTVEKSSGCVQIVLVFNLSENESHSQDNLKASLQNLWERQKDLWHSLWINCNQRRDNVIFSDSWQVIRGQEWLWEVLQGKSVCFHSASFVQANLEMFDRLLERVRTFCPKGARAVEFYAGVGAIGISLIEDCQALQCVEIVPIAKRCFEESCKRLPKELAERLSYISGKAVDQRHLLKDKVDLIIVDPPRKGLEGNLLKAFCETTGKKRLIYISCGWESFKRDCDALIKAGWHLHAAEGFLFFPGSDHLETLAVFDKG